MASSVNGPRDRMPDVTTRPTEFNRMAEYVAVMQHYASVSSRRQYITSVFVSLNVAFLTAIGFILWSSHLSSWWNVVAVAAIALVVAPINLGWRQTVARHQVVTEIYYSYLLEIEKDFQAEAIRETDQREQGRDPAPLIGVYHRQGAIGTIHRHSAPAIEKRLATYFVALYPGIAAATALATYLVASHAITGW